MSGLTEWFGVLNVNKPEGWTSRKVVDHVQRLVKPVKVGHAGTLDPLASGVLIVCVGPATRLVPFLHELPKAYHGEFLLNCTSDTCDVQGDVRNLECPVSVSRQAILEALPRFTGRIQQTPPAYSAVKVDGRRAYDLARQGQMPDLKPREVEIHQLALVDYAVQRFALEIECSTGTYVRSLGRDLARSVGSDAVMSRLVRTRIGPYSLDQSIRPEQISRATLGDLLRPPQSAVSHLPQIVGDDAEVAALRQGRRIAFSGPAPPSEKRPCAILSKCGRLIAIADYDPADAMLAPKVVFH